MSDYDSMDAWIEDELDVQSLIDDGVRDGKSKGEIRERILRDATEKMRKEHAPHGTLAEYEKESLVQEAGFANSSKSVRGGNANTMNRIDQKLDRELTDDTIDDAKRDLAEALPSDVREEVTLDNAIDRLLEKRGTKTFEESDTEFEKDVEAELERIINEKGLAPGEKDALRIQAQQSLETDRFKIEKQARELSQRLDRERDLTSLKQAIRKETTWRKSGIEPTLLRAKIEEIQPEVQQQAIRDVAFSAIRADPSVSDTKIARLVGRIGSKPTRASDVEPFADEIRQTLPELPTSGRGRGKFRL